MKKKLVVLIGAPGSGKTTLIDTLLKKGFVCYPEVSRKVIQEAQKQGIDQLFLENPLLFSELLLKGRIEQFENAVNEKTDIIFFDRGIPDVPAYMKYIKMPYPDDFTKPCLNFRYTEIFILPTWKEIYAQDTERYETFSQAEEIQQHLEETYTNLGYNPICVPKDTVENRVKFILDRLKD